MNILVTCSSSTLGTACIERFFADGHRIIATDFALRKSANAVHQLQEQVGNQQVDIAFLLEGEMLLANISTSRSLKKRAHILIQQNLTTLRWLNELPVKPKIIFLASSVHLYPALVPGMEVQGETQIAGEDYIARFFATLERNTAQLKMTDSRIVYLRLARLITRKSKANGVNMPLLDHMIPVIFPGNKLKMSWVSIDDTMRAITKIISTPLLSGPVNVASGDFVTLHEYLQIEKSRSTVLHTFPLPNPLARAILGKELASYLSNSKLAVPQKLMNSGFLFEDISLQEYLGSQQQTARP